MLDSDSLDTRATLPSKQINCWACWLRNLCLAHEFSGRNVDTSKVITRNRKFLRGTHLFRQGDEFHRLYTLKSGAIKSYISNTDGTEQIVEFHFPGDVIGLDALTNQKYHSSAIALEKSFACAFPYSCFKGLCHSNPDLHYKIETQLSNSIQQKHEFLMILNTNTAEAKVAHFLCDISMRFSLRGLSPSDLHLHMSRVEIGNYLGLAPETVSRILTKFERKGLIRAKSKNILLKDFPALRDYSPIR